MTFLSLRFFLLFLQVFIVSFFTFNFFPVFFLNSLNTRNFYYLLVNMILILMQLKNIKVKFRISQIVCFQNILQGVKEFQKFILRTADLGRISLIREDKET